MLRIIRFNGYMLEGVGQRFQIKELRRTLSKYKYAIVQLTHISPPDHIEERSPSNIIVFSVQERDKAKRQDEIQTYIYDKVEKYVIVLRCQRKGGYYLLTAYHLNRPYAEKQLLKKMKSKLNDVL